MLTASELLMREPVPLHRVHEAIFAFCRAHDGVVIFGAQAVNFYVREPRMSQDVDVLSATPEETANELARTLGAELHLAVRVREVAPGKGYRVYQARKEGSRHLADVRLADFSPDDAVEDAGLRYVSRPLIVRM